MLRRHVDMYQMEKANLANLARTAAFRGLNYRDFLVGSAILGFNGQEYKIFEGANLMLAKDEAKICAEGHALRNLTFAGYSQVIAIAVAGLPQPDKESGIISPTLHPCGGCRGMLIRLKERQVVQDDTRIYTVHLFEDIEEEYELQDIIKLHTRSQT